MERSDPLAAAAPGNNHLAAAAAAADQVVLTDISLSLPQVACRP